MVFDFSVEPFIGAREYACRIVQVRAKPFVDTYVRSPDLQGLAPGRALPHIYGHEDSVTKLCLYTPMLCEWHPAMWLTDSAVPWTVNWLRYFEQWLVDGKWRGGGTHPSSIPRRRYGMAGR